MGLLNRNLNTLKINVFTYYFSLLLLPLMVKGSLQVAQFLPLPVCDLVQLALMACSPSAGPAGDYGHWPNVAVAWWLECLPLWAACSSAC